MYRIVVQFSLYFTFIHVKFIVFIVFIFCCNKIVAVWRGSIFKYLSETEDLFCLTGSELGKE